ncbi:MAG: hypothetical protein Q9164_005245 [Protoblastenia rupestris]
MAAGKEPEAFEPATESQDAAVPSPKVSSDTSDSGYGSTETKPEENLQKTQSRTEGVILPSRGLLPKRNKPTKLKIFDKEIPISIQNRFYDLNELFGKPLQQHLTNLGVNFSSISIKLKILGDCEESAKPWIVVMCNKKATKRTKQFFNMSHIKSEYQPRGNNQVFPSFEVLVCSRPPTQIAIGPSLTTRNRSSILTEPHSNLVFSQRIGSDTTCGSFARVGDPALGRIATLGGIIKVEKPDASYMLYSMTVGHVLRPSELYNNEHVPNALEKDEDEETEEEEYFLDEEDSTNEPSLELPHEVEELHTGHEKNKSPVSGDSWWAIGHVSTTSEDDVANSSGLDWALITFHDPFLYQPNLLSVPHTSSEAPQIRCSPEKEQSIKADTSSCSVFLINGLKGLQRGSISATLSYLMVAPAKTFSKHYTLSFADTSALSAGICGSWVVSETNHEVLGHVVASDIMGEAYVVPIHATFLDIKQKHGARSVSLPTGSDISRWLEYCTPWLKVSAEGVPTLQDSTQSPIRQSRLHIPSQLSPPKISSPMKDTSTNHFQARLDSAAVQIDPHKSHDIIITVQNARDLGGYEFTRLEDQFGQLPSWALVKRKPMQLRLDQMKKLVREQERTENPAEKLLEDLEGTLRSQILRLLDDLANGNSYYVSRCRLGFLNLIKDSGGETRVVEAIVLLGTSQFLPGRSCEIIDLADPGRVGQKEFSFGHSSVPPRAPLMLPSPNNHYPAWFEQSCAPQLEANPGSQRANHATYRGSESWPNVLSGSTAHSGSMTQSSYFPTIQDPWFQPSQPIEPGKPFISNTNQWKPYNQPPAMNFPPFVGPKRDWPQPNAPRRYVPQPFPPNASHIPQQGPIPKQPSFERRRPKSVKVQSPEIVEIDAVDSESSDGIYPKTTKSKRKQPRGASARRDSSKQHRRHPLSNEDNAANSDSTDLSSIFSADSSISDSITNLLSVESTSRHPSMIDRKDTLPRHRSLERDRDRELKVAREENRFREVYRRLLNREEDLRREKDGGRRDSRRDNRGSAHADKSTAAAAGGSGPKRQLDLKYRRSNTYAGDRDERKRY